MPSTRLRNKNKENLEFNAQQNNKKENNTKKLKVLVKNLPKELSEVTNKRNKPENMANEDEEMKANVANPIPAAPADDAQNLENASPPKRQKVNEEIPPQAAKEDSNTDRNKSNDVAASTSTATKDFNQYLHQVISNLYLNVVERLKLDFSPRCLDDLAHCHRHHYRSDSPEAPISTQAHSLRSALQQHRYISSINSTIDMCYRGEFPGKGIFTKVIELVLSINFNNDLLYQHSYLKCINLFSILVRTFPPCWHKMRPYYIGFLECGLDHNKISCYRDKPLSKSSKIFDILLDLLEVLLKECPQEILQKSHSHQTSAAISSMAITTTADSEITSPMNSMDLSTCSEYWNQQQYEERERKKQTFEGLEYEEQFERVFVSLRLLLQILENDLAMWMLHHNKKTKEWIFCSENRPLIVVLCELTQYTRMTRVARRIFGVYSEAAFKGVHKNRLEVLERFIALLMVASNTADMENTAIGVKYPFLGDQTKTLIKEFFKIFKSHNQENISKYMETIKLLRIPFVRYEFIDNVLFTNVESLTPQKIALDMLKKRWLKYKPQADLNTANEDISREQYLHLMLDALKQYCQWHGLKEFLNFITDSTKKWHPLTTTNDSVHRWPTHGSGVLNLKKMSTHITDLEQKIKMTVRMSKPKVDLPLADIYIDDPIMISYRTDLKFVINLLNVVIKQKDTYPEVDFSDWLLFLNDFSTKKN